MKARLLLIAPLALTMMTSPALASASANNWEDFRGSQTNCVKQAIATLISLEYTDVSTVSNATIYGNSDGYQSVIRCAAVKSVAFLYTHGPETNIAVAMNERVQSRFKRLNR
jgi:hypothetical protein